MDAVKEFRVVLTVPDFDAAVAFYRDALGLEQVADGAPRRDARSSWREAGRP